MNFTIRPVAPSDREDVVDIFNYYVENSLAAYPEQKLPYEFFDKLMRLSKGYPFNVVEVNGKVIGFGLLESHAPFGNRRHVVELDCFLGPEHTGMGIGTAMLDRLVGDARSLGVDTIIVSVSSENPGGIRFHIKYGFVECGRFRHNGKKFGKGFDEVWLRLLIRP